MYKCELTGIEFPPSMGPVVIKLESGKQLFTSIDVYVLLLQGCTIKEIRDMKKDLKKKFEDENFFKDAYFNATPDKPRA